MVTAQFPNGREVTRNKSFFKPTPNVPPNSLIEQEPELEIWGEIEKETMEPNIADGRQRREIKKPKRLIEEM